MKTEKLHSIFLNCKSVSIDTRKIEKDAMFFAIKGENFDANTFAKKALSCGAKYAVIDNKDYYIDSRTIVVKNSLKTLQELSSFHRKHLNIPIISITGSNGKTTTKEIINVVLSKKYKVKATVGNYNNHIGVPLTLLSFTNETEIGIVEMGANHQKEIAFLCKIAKPDYGYITNFGKAHLEGFGGVEGVIKGKSEMYDYLRHYAKKAFINKDDSIQVENSIGIKTIEFSQKDSNVDLFVSKVEANPFVTICFEDIEVNSCLIGAYNANNINAAILIGKYFEVDKNDIKLAIEGYKPTNNRSQIIFKNSNEIILDAYNANPSSMEAALKNFIELDKNNKVVFLGDMFELGKDSLKEHKAIVKSLTGLDNVKCVFVGESYFKCKQEDLNMFFYNSFDDLIQEIKKLEIKNATVLIKGSRGMALERILEHI